MSTATGIRAGRAFVELFADDAQLRAGLKRAEARLKGFAAAGRQAGLALTAAAGAVVVPTAVAMRTFASFEKAMSRVAGLTRASEAEMTELSNEARRLGASTVFSASQAAEAMGNFAQAGMKTTDILKASGPTLHMAAAGQLDMATAADIATKIMKGMGLETDELGSVVDLLTKAMTNSNTNLQQLGDAMRYVGPAAKTAGISLEEIVAAIAMLSDAGMQGDMAGTILRGTLQALTGPSAEAAAEMERLGVVVADSQGNVRKLADIIEDLQRGMAGMGSAEKLESIGKIFDARQATGVAELISQGSDNLRKFTASMKDSKGTAEELSKALLDNLSGDLENLLGASDELQISLGEGLVAGIRKAVRAVTEAVNAAAKWIKEHQQIARLAVGVAVAVGGIGAALIGVSVATTVAARVTAGFIAISKAAAWAHNAIALLPHVANKAGLALRGLAMAMVLNPAWLAVGAIVAGLAAIGYAAHNAAERALEVKEALKLKLETGDTRRKEDMAQLQAMQAAVKAGKLNAAQLAAAQELVDDLTERYGDLGIRVNKSTGEVEGLAQAFAKLPRAMRQKDALPEVSDRIKEIEESLEKLAVKSAMAKAGRRGLFQDDQTPVIEAEAKALREELAILEKRRRLLRKGISGSETGSTPDITAAAGAPGTAAGAATGPAEAPESGAAQEWSRKLHQLRLEQIDDEQERARALLKERYDFEYAKAQEAGENAATLDSIQKSYLAEYAKLREEQSREQLAEELRINAEISEARIQAIDDEHEREQASIRNKYDLERRLAKLYGKPAGQFDALEGAELAAAAAAEGRREQEKTADIETANAKLRDEIEELALRNKYRGYELELKLLALQKKQATEKAKAAGEDLALVEEKYALEEALLRKQREDMGSVGGFDVEAIVGTFAAIGRDLANAPRPGGPGSKLDETMGRIGDDKNPTTMQQVLELIAQNTRQTAEGVRRLQLTFT